MLDNSNKPSKEKANSTIQISYQKKNPTRQKEKGGSLSLSLSHSLNDTKLAYTLMPMEARLLGTSCL